MCLAIVKPGPAVIPESHLRQGWISNSDGAGFSYIKEGKVCIEKGFMELKDFLAAYQVASTKYKSSPFLIHFRIRSMGNKTADNTHPFVIAGGALIHNGSLDGTGAQYGEGPSDTAMFAARFAADLTFDIVNNNKKEFDSALGYNKMCMLYDDGKYAIINEKDGVWKDDVWYSNHSFTPRHPHACNSSIVGDDPHCEPSLGDDMR